MHFKGHLLLPGEPGPGLRVNLDLAEHHLAVESDGDGLGAWPLETVAVERLQGDVFALTVAGEALRFVADDTIAFTYSAVPTIERISRRPQARARTGFRSMLNRIWNGPGEPASPEPVMPASPVAGEPGTDGGSIASAIVEETAEASTVLKAGVFEGIGDSLIEFEESVDVAGSSETNTDPTVEVLESISIPFVEIDDLVEVVEETIVSGPPIVSESSPTWEDLADSAGCPAVRSDGRRCESPILTSSGYCYPHDPKRALADKYQSAQEARARLKRDATDRLNRVYTRLDKALRRVERGDLDPETAMAMAQLARTMCAILDIDESATGDPSQAATSNETP